MRPRFLCQLLLSLLAVGCLNTRTYAQESDFDTTYNIEYQVDSSLVVSVKENIGVINQNASSVPSSFIETIKNISIYDIKVLDSKDREITPLIEEKENEMIIKIPIEDPAVGKDKKTEVTLLYKTRDLAQKTGRILNLNIPKAPVSDFMQEYNVTLKIPRDFGPQISVTPKPAQEKMEEEGYSLLYNKQTLENYGISATFGDYQIFDYTVKYEFKNDSFLAKTVEAALPMPLKDYQEVSIGSISPQPLRLVKDADGNILAEYKLIGKKSLKVVVVGKSKVYNNKVNTEGNGVESIPFEVKSNLRGQKYWETGDNVVKQIAQSITNKQAGVNANALAIYTFLTKNITYDFDRAKKGGVLERKGAVQTLLDKKGLCLDFTDAFIALARTSGIPAREVDGYAYTKDPSIAPTPLGSDNNKLLHSWAQFYNPQLGWVSVDPTWGTTSGLDYFSKLDNNHMAFVIKGLDSQNPQPVQQIEVQFSDDDFFNHESEYNLENLPVKGAFNAKPFFVATSVLVLGLCTIFFLSKVRPNSRYK